MAFLHTFISSLVIRSMQRIYVKYCPIKLTGFWIYLYFYFAFFTWKFGEKKKNDRNRNLTWYVRECAIFFRLQISGLLEKVYNYIQQANHSHGHRHNIHRHKTLQLIEVNAFSRAIDRHSISRRQKKNKNTHTHVASCVNQRVMYKYVVYTSESYIFVRKPDHWVCGSFECQIWNLSLDMYRPRIATNVNACNTQSASLISLITLFFVNVCFFLFHL